MDGRSHSVQFYSDVTGDWISGVKEDAVQWNTTLTHATIYHQMSRTALSLTEDSNGSLEDGVLYFAMANVSF